MLSGRRKKQRLARDIPGEIIIHSRGATDTLETKHRGFCVHFNGDSLNLARNEVQTRPEQCSVPPNIRLSPLSLVHLFGIFAVNIRLTGSRKIMFLGSRARPVRSLDIVGWSTSKQPYRTPTQKMISLEEAAALRWADPPSKESSSL
jgi:hypothetical protein